MLVRTFTACLLCATTARAQSETTRHTFYTPRDGAIAAAFFAGSAGLSLFDARIAQHFQDTSWFHVRIGHKLDNYFTHINETTLSFGGLGVWAIGRALGAHEVASVGLHVSEAVAAASLTAQVIRGPLGRTRPKDTEHPYENPFEFHFMKGFRHFEQRSFPSIHSSSGFAAASVLVAEVHDRAPRATWWVGVPAYAMALTPGLSRMYLGQHWASDIFAGAYLGTFYGWRVVQYAHAHSRTPIDRIFLPVGWTVKF